MKRLGICLVAAVVAVTLSAASAFASISSDIESGMPLEEILAGALDDNSTPEEIESVLMQMVQGGAFAGEAVMLALSEGYDPVAVITGAVLGGGPLMSIISAVAVNSPMTVDEAASVCLRCGADAEDVASAVALAMQHLENIGYSEEDKGGEDGLAEAGEPVEQGEGYDAGESSTGTDGLPPLWRIPSGGAGGGGSSISPNS